MRPPLKAPIYDVDAAGCWIWTGPIGSDGIYGRWRGTTAQRAVYQYFGFVIPDGLELDHLCRVQLCVNPAHLEPVTHAENNRRAAAARTVCKHGHQLTAENIYMASNGSRECRTCSQRSWRDSKRRQRAAMRAAS